MSTIVCAVGLVVLWVLGAWLIWFTSKIDTGLPNNRADKVFLIVGWPVAAMISLAMFLAVRDFRNTVRFGLLSDDDDGDDDEGEGDE